nr:MAG TPA: hypothetical protein [Caudoviricetes sp.]
MKRRRYGIVLNRCARKRDATGYSQNGMSWQIRTKIC